MNEKQRLIIICLAITALVSGFPFDFHFVSSVCGHAFSPSSVSGVRRVHPARICSM